MSIIRSMIRSIINPFGDGQERRYFATLDPSLNSRYSYISVAYSGSFYVEYEFQSTSTSTADALRIGRMLVQHRASEIRVYPNLTASGSDNASFATTSTSDGMLHRLKIEAEQGGQSFTFTLDDNEPVNVVSSGTATVDTLSGLYFIGYGGGATYFNGVIANFKLSDTSGVEEVTTTFELKEPTENTEQSVEGNNTVTYVDVQNREEFVRSDGGWLGVEELTINGSFSSGLDGWSDTSEAGGSLAVVNGVAELTSSSGASGQRARIVNTEPMQTTPDYVYSIQFYRQNAALNCRGGTASQGNNTLGDFQTISGLNNRTFVANSVNFYANWYGQSNGTASLDNVSVRRFLDTPWLGDQIAHRGYPDDAPENTLSAYTNTVSVGTLHLECDVRLTSDGVYVLMHDLTINRTSNGTGNIEAMTFAQADIYDYGSWFSPAFTGEKILKFDDFCAFADANNCTIYPEVKTNMSALEIQGMVDIVVANNLENKCVMVSVNPNVLAIVRAYNANITLGYTSTNLIDTSIMLPNSYAFVLASTLASNIDYIKKTQSKGFKVGVWTINNQTLFDTFANTSIDAMMSDTKYTET